MLLKNGSRGERVEILQRFLGIESDGIFGNGTEQAVKAWQRAHGLLDDGIVGAKTYGKMGLVSTDTYTSTFDSIEDDDDVIVSHLDSDEYLHGPTTKEWVWLHHTAGWENPYKTIRGWNNDTRGKIGTEFVIGGQSIKDNSDTYDGLIVDCIPDGGYAWHLGIGDNYIHKHSVGIEVCNWGYVTNGGYTKGGKWIPKTDGRYYTYVGVEADPSQLVTLKQPFKGHSVWHKYSDKQVQSLKKLIIKIGERDNIDVRKGLPELIKKIGAKAFDYDVTLLNAPRGVWSHSNVRKDKVDLFPQDEIMIMLTEL